MSDKFLTKSKFTELVKDRVLKYKMGYIDAVLEICEEHAIDPQDVKKFISPAVQEKIGGEAAKLNLIENEESLRFD